VAADKVDDVVDLYPAECENCWATLPEQPDPDAKRYQWIKVPPVQPYIKDPAPRGGLSMLRTQDPRCLRRAGDPASPFGPRLMSIVALGVIAIDESYDVSANVFSPVDQRKKAPPAMALEPWTLELVRRHQRYLMERNHPGLATGLVFPSEAGTRPSATTSSTTCGGRRR
jgi:hypothetical protein